MVADGDHGGGIGSIGDVTVAGDRRGTEEADLAGSIAHQHDTVIGSIAKDAVIVICLPGQICRRRAAVIEDNIAGVCAYCDLKSQYAMATTRVVDQPQSDAPTAPAATNGLTDEVEHL